MDASKSPRPPSRQSSSQQEEDFSLRASVTERLGDRLAGLPKAYIDIICGSLVITSTSCMGMVMIYLQDVWKPFVYGIIFMYLLSPVVNALTTPISITVPFSNNKLAGDDGTQLQLLVGNNPKKAQSRMHKMYGVGMNRTLSFAIPYWFAVGLAMLMAIAFICVVSNLIITNLMTLQDNFPKYHDEGLKKLEQLMRWMERMNLRTEDIEKISYKWVKEIPFPSILENLMTACMSIAEHSVMTTLFTVYLLLSRSPRHSTQQPPTLESEIDRQVRQYLVLKTFLSTLVGLLVFVFLWFLEVDFAFMFGMITFIANYIPNVGALFATVLPLPIVLLDPHMTFASRVLAFVLPFLTHAFVGNVVEPMVFGDSFDLHPVVVLLSLAIWGQIWGIGGMVLSVPLTAVLRISMKQFKHPYAVMLTSLLQGKLHDIFEDRYKAAD